MIQSKEIFCPVFSNEVMEIQVQKVLIALNSHCERHINCRVYNRETNRSYWFALNFCSPLHSPHSGTVWRTAEEEKRRKLNNLLSKGWCFCPPTCPKSQTNVVTSAGHLNTSCWHNSCLEKNHIQIRCLSFQLVPCIKVLFFFPL